MKKSPEYDGPHNLTNRMDPTLKLLGRGSKFVFPGQFFPSGSNFILPRVCQNRPPLLEPLGANLGLLGAIFWPAWLYLRLNSRLISDEIFEIRFEIDLRLDSVRVVVLLTSPPGP